MRKTFRAFVASAIIWMLSVAPAFSLERVSIRVDNCFAEMVPQGVFPIKITIRNLGPSLEGALRVSASQEYGGGASHDYLYPVSLPSGTIKSIIAYPLLESYSNRIRVSFSGPARVQDVEHILNIRSGNQNIGLIGDTTGGLTALRPDLSQNDKNPASAPAMNAAAEAAALNDCYARPEDAPDRAIGYLGLKVLVITNGAERMNAAQWDAIRQWVLTGGHIILLGGANAPYLKIPEIQPLMPLENLTTTSVSGLRLDIEKQPDPPRATAAITTGDLRKGAQALRLQNEKPLLASRPYGAGMALFVAFNPQEEPLRRWKGVGAVWKFIAAWAQPYVITESLTELNANTAQSYSYMRYGSGMGGMSGTISDPMPEGGDPFRVKLPPFQMILWYFVVYCVVVVFLAYFLLKAFKKLEWNWLLGPLLAAAFSYGLFLFTADLYKAALSRRTSGVVFAAAGESAARFEGYSELFFPRAGAYSIQIPNAEILDSSMPWGTSRYDYYGQKQELTTVDSGVAEAPNFSAGNLAFRRLHHAQPVSIGGAFTASLRRKGDGALTGAVQNGTQWDMKDVQMHLVNQKTLSLGDMKRGERKTLSSGKAMAEAQQGGGEAYNPFGRIFNLQYAQRGCAFLTGTISGETFGPTLGNYADSSTHVRVIVSLPITGGDK